MNQTGHESLLEASRGQSGSAVRSADGESVETALQLAVDLHGPGLLNRPDKLKLHLDTQCPAAGSDISFLLAALEERVPQALLAMTSAAQMQTVVPQLQETLAERRGINPFAASWAVSTWASALRMDLFGDPVLRGSGKSDGSARAGASRAPDAARARFAAPDASPVFSRNTTAAPAPFTVSFGVPAKAAPGPAVAAARSPTPPSSDPAPRIVVPFLARMSEPAADRDRPAEPEDIAPVAASGPARSEPDEPTAQTVSTPAIAPPAVAAQIAEEALRETEAPIAEPRVTSEAIPSMIEPVTPTTMTIPEPEPAPAHEETAPVAADAVATAASPVPFDPPPWAVAGETPALLPQPKRFDPWLGVAGVVAAIVVAFAAIRLMASLNGPQQPQVAEAPPPAVAPAAANPPVPAASVASAAPSIVDVVSDPDIVGDGKEHDVFVAIDPSRGDVRSVEVTFMSGDGTWEPRSRVIDVRPDAIRNGRIAVGRVGLRTTAPATATFQYVLTAADGQRSTPFVKQFVFAPVAARAPQITDVVVPPSVVAGTPFTLTINFTPGESGIASVERRTLGAEGPPRVTSLAGLASPKEGTLRYPAEAIASASRTTFAFTLVDRDGARSEPKEVVVEATAPKRDTVEPTPAKPETFACTRANCGSVVSVREIDRSKTYEVIARMDDRTIQTMVSTATWKVGTRVRKAGARLVPVDAVAPPARPKAAGRAPVPLLPESPPIFDR